MMASGLGRIAQCVAMAAILLVAMAGDAHPAAEGTCSVECACADKCIRKYPRIDDDPPFKITPVCTHRMEQELYAHLYLHHSFFGAHKSQVDVLNLHKSNLFGDMIVNDWVITDGPGLDTKVVAHAKGIHVQAGKDKENYYVSFNMVFDDGRFKGSTLQVMGTVVEKGEWAIVGGTGEFTFARGVIYKPHTTYNNQEGDVIKLDIRCLYTPMKSSEGTAWTFEA